MPRSARRPYGAVALLAATLAASPAWPQESSSIATADELDAALEQRSTRAERDLATVRALLERDEVRQAAEATGLELEQASAAIALLEPQELEMLSETAQLLDASLVGGQAPVVSGRTGTHFPFLYVGILLAIIVVFLFT